MISLFHRLVNRSVCIMWFKRHPNEIRFGPKVRLAARSTRAKGAKRLIRDFSSEAGSKRTVISFGVGNGTREPAVDRVAAARTISPWLLGDPRWRSSLPSCYALGSLSSGVSLRGKKRTGWPCGPAHGKTVPSRGYWCISDTISQERKLMRLCKMKLAY